LRCVLLLGFLCPEFALVECCCPFFGLTGFQTHRPFSFFVGPTRNGLSYFAVLLNSPRWPVDLLLCEANDFSPHVLSGVNSSGVLLMFSCQREFCIRVALSLFVGVRSVPPSKAHVPFPLQTGVTRLVLLLQCSQKRFPLFKFFSGSAAMLCFFSGCLFFWFWFPIRDSFPLLNPRGGWGPSPATDLMVRFLISRIPGVSLPSFS